MFRSVRSSTDERSRRLPGDEFPGKTIGSSLTHAITIRRPPHDVWPSLGWVPAGEGPPLMTWAFVLEEQGAVSLGARKLVTRL